MIDFNFKPEFGNQKHIEIVDLISELRKEEVLLSKKVEEYTALRTIKGKIKKLEEDIIRLIKEDE